MVLPTQRTQALTVTHSANRDAQELLAFGEGLGKKLISIATEFDA